MAVISSLAHTLTAQQAFLRTSASIDLSSLIKCDRPPAFLNCTTKQDKSNHTYDRNGPDPTKYCFYYTDKLWRLHRPEIDLCDITSCLASASQASEATACVALMTVWLSVECSSSTNACIAPWVRMHLRSSSCDAMFVKTAAACTAAPAQLSRSCRTRILSAPASYTALDMRQPALTI